MSPEPGSVGEGCFTGERQMVEVVNFIEECIEDAKKTNGVKEMGIVGFVLDGDCVHPVVTVKESFISLLVDPVYVLGGEDLNSLFRMTTDNEGECRQACLGSISGRREITVDWGGETKERSYGVYQYFGFEEVQVPFGFISDPGRPNLVMASHPDYVAINWAGHGNESHSGFVLFNPEYRGQRIEAKTISSVYSGSLEVMLRGLEKAAGKV